MSLMRNKTTPQTHHRTTHTARCLQRQPVDGTWVRRVLGGCVVDGLPFNLSIHTRASIGREKVGRLRSGLDLLVHAHAVLLVIDWEGQVEGGSGEGLSVPTRPTLTPLMIPVCVGFQQTVVGVGVGSSFSIGQFFHFTFLSWLNSNENLPYPS